MTFQTRCVQQLILISSFICVSQTKVYERCELARELQSTHNIQSDQLATWVCIGYHESRYNTTAVNKGTGDHGLFQISEYYWCSASGDDILACGVPCSAFEDDDIEDDIVCAKRIFRQHQRLTGNGFNAWAVYGHYCKDPSKVSKYVAGCFEQESKIANRNPRLQFFLNVKYNKYFEESFSKPSTTTQPLMIPGNICLCPICPGLLNLGCNTSVQSLSTTTPPAVIHHHEHQHHYHFYSNSTNHLSSSSRPQNTQDVSAITSSTTLLFTSTHRPTPSSSFISSGNSQSSTTRPSIPSISNQGFITGRPTTTSNTNIFSNYHHHHTSSPSPANPVNVVDLNTSNSITRPPYHQHHTHHHQYPQTTKKPFHWKPKFEIFGKPFGNFIQSSSNVENGKESRDAVGGRQIKGTFLNHPTVYTEVANDNYQFSLNSNGFKLKLV